MILSSIIAKSVMGTSFLLMLIIKISGQEPFKVADHEPRLAINATQIPEEVAPRQIGWPQMQHPVLCFRDHQHRM